MSQFPEVVPPQLLPRTFVALSGSRLALSHYAEGQRIKLMEVDWVRGRVELRRTLYRGKNPKPLSLHFGGGGSHFAAISYDRPNSKRGVLDATLHLFYAEPSAVDQTSNRRYYFRTWTDFTRPNDRAASTRLTFGGVNAFRIISSNDFYIYHSFDPSNVVPIGEILKDYLKNSWQQIK